jgi:hypothetical protein
MGFSSGFISWLHSYIAIDRNWLSQLFQDSGASQYHGLNIEVAAHDYVDPILPVNLAVATIIIRRLPCRL